jgi:hypothetical protein
MSEVWEWAKALTAEDAEIAEKSEPLNHREHRGAQRKAFIAKEA